MSTSDSGVPCVGGGGTPDLDSSPEVLTWRRTLRGGRSAETALLSAVAPLVEERVWMA